MDETYIRVHGQWVYLYRAVDKAGQTVDFFLSRNRDVNAAKSFLRSAMKNTRVPTKITWDAYAASHRAVREMKEDGELPCRVKVRSSQYLNNLVEQDHRRVMDLLHITSIRPGRNGMNPQAPDYANYDEAKANPYPNLPDALVLKNGKKVASARTWWRQRRPEIVEDFDREIYGRAPTHTPKVKWEVTATTQETNGEFAVVTKKLRTALP